MELTKNLKVLSDDELYRIHMNIMEVLWQIGIMVEEEESLKLLEKNGARVDYEAQRAYLPPDLVQHSLDVMCHSFFMYDMAGEKVMELGGTKTYYGTCGYSTTFVDNDGKEKEGTYDALAKEARLVDTIDQISIIEPSIQPCDMPAQLQDLYMVKDLLVNTRKPIHTVANSGPHMQGIAELIGEMVGGEEELMKKPRVLMNLCTFSPLGIRKDCCEVIREAAKYNIPCGFSTGPMAGATSPVTLAGTVVQSFAEALGHIVLAQCYKPGLPCTILHAARIFDMKFAACTVATPEFPVMKVAASQLAHFYRIPIMPLSPISDSNEYDVQYGWEKFMTGFISRQCGSNLELSCGLFSQLNQFSYVALALDAEIIQVIERIGRGMEVNDYSLAFDVLQQEGVKAEFLYHPQTLKNFKKEFFTPVLTDRAPYTNYLKREGANTLVDRALKQLEKYEKSYDYTKGKEKEEDLQKIIDRYAKEA